MTIKLFVITLWAEEVNTCAHFYRDVIGLSMIDVHADQPHFDLGGANLGIRKTRSVPLRARDFDRFPIVAFSIDDLDAAIDRLQQHHIDLPWALKRTLAGVGSCSMIPCF